MVKWPNFCSIYSTLDQWRAQGAGGLKKKTWHVIPARATARTSSLRLNADDHNWWTTMPVKRHQQSGAEKKKKKMKTKPARHFQVGYIHNQRSIKTIYIYFVVIKTDLSQQQPLKWVKMNYIKQWGNPAEKNTIEPSQKILIPSQINHKCHYKPSTFNH